MAEMVEDLRVVLLQAGWEPERCVDVARWRIPFAQAGLSMHDAAAVFLSEFGGLDFPYAGPGISRAREHVQLDPLLALGEEDLFIEWGQLVGRHIFPLGELDDGRYFIGIDESSSIYLVADWLGHFGEGMHGIESLILGVVPETVHTSYPTG
ncbi:SUKH-3 domain-containing protein [Micromonospora matsumotoense]|uniref:SUKH-3 domain-containing protein n=1 Tax=Micromonospora matsumotoense TaxID=121616 RepID=UPI0033CC8D5B